MKNPSKKLALRIVALFFLVIAGYATATTLNTVGLPQLRLFSGELSLNKNLLYVAAQYPTGNSDRVLPPSEHSLSYGVTEDIYYMGRRVASADSEGRVYCVGLMFEIYMKACQRVGGRNVRLSGISTTNFATFRRDWYGVDGDRRTFVRTLVERGLGKEIEGFQNALPGDLVQFWRIGGSGHSVLFLDWIRGESGEVLGIYYWSIQSKNGISENTEYFADAGGGILRDQVFIVRAYVP